MNVEVLENRLMERLASGFGRSPLQRNGLQESDAEILDGACVGGRQIALTIDSVVEEIAAGLYGDPYLAGWASIMASLSDLAAVGADPLGVLVSEVLEDGMPPASIDRLQAGLRDACQLCGTFVLGGDTNSGDALMLTTCAIGLVDANDRLSRLGCRAGDELWTTGRAGIGNAFALARLGRGGGTPVAYRPVGRLVESRSLRGLATACMDTSDGLLATVDQLGRLNGVGFRLDPGWETALHPDALAAARGAAMDSWLLLAGPHGDFELLFTVPPGRVNRLLASSKKSGWQPVRLGVATVAPAIALHLGGRYVPVDTGSLRNLAYGAAGNLDQYVSALRKVGAAMEGRTS